MEITKVKSKIVIDNSFILKPGYHMNYGKKRIEKAIYNKFPFDSLGNVSGSVFTGGIFKRVFVDDPKYGDPYISAQHMMSTNPLEVAKIISKKYTPRQEEMSLKKNQILVSCAGTVGNVRLITKDLEGVIGSQDIIRINPDDTKLPYGYLYAYLSSKTAYNYMQSYIYGSVVPRIEPNTLSKLPIPLLSEEKQLQIHQLIVEVSELRVEANLALKKAQTIYNSKLSIEKTTNNIDKINSKELKSNMRFGGNFFLSKGNDFENKILQMKFSFLSNYVKNIFTSGRDKRNYTSESNGIPFLSNGDISSFNPFKSCNYIVKKIVKDQSLIKRDMILTGRVGQDTVGKVYLPYNLLIDTVASDNIIRIKISDEDDINMLFAFLSSDIGNEIIRKRKTGVGQPFVTEEMFLSIPIPHIEKEEKVFINENVDKYRDNIDKSLSLELKAIALIEKEIDLWQLS